jgi:16S rRNA (cytosine1402-N4)-methyltransferase
MRMAGSGPTAADVVASASERNLAAVILALGEERRARAVARAVVAARRQREIETTAALAAIVARVVHARRGDIHPATRTFQALRLIVNAELSQLAQALAAAERLLRPGGRLVVVAFHSLEDRIVKTFLAGRGGGRRDGGSRHLPQTQPAPATFEVVTRRPVTPQDAEVRANPRARSAKLRAAGRTDAPARQDVPASMPALLPRLPSLADLLRGE